MDKFTFPVSRQQKDFERMATELIRILSTLQETQQNALFEYACKLYSERKSIVFTQWDE